MGTRLSTIVALVCALVFPAAAARAQDSLAPIRFLEGEWIGKNKGEPGEGTGERRYAAVFGARFIEGRNKVVYPPTEKTKGEVHEDLSVFSFDSARKKIVLRQFHVEGFVNQYVCDPIQGSVVCETEAIENIPAGWRARLTWITRDGELFEKFELAAPGKEYAPYSEARLKKR